MPHPADFRDPGELRAMLHGAYEGYAQGVNMFPGLRVRRSPESLPLKTRQIATILGQAWATIDLDLAYFNRALEVAVDKAQNPDSDMWRMTVMTQIGRNAVNFGHVSMEDGDDRPLVTYAQFALPEFLEQFEGVEFTGANGATMKLQNGELVGDAPFGSGLMMRGTRAGGIFTKSPRDTLDFMRDLTDQPISVIRSVDTLEPLDTGEEE